MGLSLLAIVLLSPVALVISTLILRQKAGPVFFRQERIGLEGQPFLILKFRTMTSDATGPAVTALDDTRVTPLGRKLRNSKLDELPQLVNVLLGDMSLMGPRPEVREYADLWSVEMRRVILSVRPGLADPVTLSLRREEDVLARSDDPEAYYREVLLEQKAHGYVVYVLNRTIPSDIYMLCRTFWRVVSG